jgi:hypothetical protein
MANISLTLYTIGFFGSVLMSFIQMRSISVNNSVTNFSRLGTLNNTSNGQNLCSTLLKQSFFHPVTVKNWAFADLFQILIDDVIAILLLVILLPILNIGGQGMH